jgi:hypothetical protein
VYNPLVTIRKSKEPGWKFTTKQILNTLPNAKRDEKKFDVSSYSFPPVEKPQSPQTSQIEINLTPPTLRRDSILIGNAPPLRRDSILHVLGIGSNTPPLPHLVLGGGRRGSTTSTKDFPSFPYKRASKHRMFASETALESETRNESTQTDSTPETPHILIDPPEFIKGLRELEESLVLIKKQLVSHYIPSVNIPSIPLRDPRTYPLLLDTKHANDLCDEILLSNERTKKDVKKTMDLILSAWEDNDLIDRIAILEDEIAKRGEGDWGLMRVWYGLIEWALVGFGLLILAVYRVLRVFGITR